MNAEKRLEFPIDEVPKYGDLHQINENQREFLNFFLKL